MIAKNNANNNNADSNNAPTIELSENFYINNNRRKNNVKIQVRLNSEGIFLRRETEQINHIDEQLIRLDDVIGSHFGPRIKKSNGGISACRRIEQNSAATESAPEDMSAFLYIYAYVKQEKPLRRNRTVRILRFRTHNRYDENLKLAKRWHRAILINKGRIGANQMLAESECDEAVEQKQLLILLNPKSGSGKGRELFHKQVAPVLKEAEMPYDLHITTHPNYARDLVRTRKDLLQRYKGIVVASGDGLFYEVLNGLMERADWRLISRRLPIGIIPCGSGNGLAKSISYCFGEPYEPKPIMNATLTCISGKTVQMDIVLIELSSGKQNTVMYSFLSVGWGLIADIDIESETLRRIGQQRFTLWSIRRLLHLRIYKGKISYLRCEKKKHADAKHAQPLSCKTLPDNDVEPERAGATNEVTDKFHDVREIGTSNGNFDDSDDGDFVDTISLDRASHRTHIDSWHSAASKRTNYFSVGGQSMRSRYSIAASIQSKIEAANAELEPQQTLNSTIPAINMPLPEETWHTEEGEYVMVHAAYTTHLSSDCFFAPESRLDDGIIYLVIIRAGVSRSQLLQFLLGLSNGTHLPEEQNQFIEVVPVSAFRIEPEDEDGIITVDGERVAYGPIQGEIFPGIINIMVPN